MPASGSGMIASSVCPDVYSTFSSGRCARSSAASSRPGLPRHHDIRQEQVDRAAVARCERERLGAVERLEHGVSLCGQMRRAASRTPSSSSTSRIVSPPVARTGSGTGPSRLDELAHDARQVDSHRRALVRLARDVDEAAALRDDPVDAREAEPRSRARLRREERLEDPRPRRGIHATAGVGDGEDDERPRRPRRSAACSGSTFAVLIVSVPPSGMASRAFSARLTRTCSTWPGSACTSQRSEPSAVDHLDVLADQAMQHLFVSTTIVFRSTMRGCSTCLRPKARSCWVSDAARSAACSIASTSARRPTSLRVEAAAQEAAVHGDDRQQVVEVVRDAAGQAADGVELLRLVQAFLELLAVADVVHHRRR